MQLVEVTELAGKDLLSGKACEQQKGEEVCICYFPNLYAERYLQHFVSWFPHGAFTLLGEVVKNGKQQILSARGMRRKLSFRLDFGQSLVFSASDLHRCKVSQHWSQGSTKVPADIWKWEGEDFKYCENRHCKGV